jgi:hypothetical protein
VERVEGSCKWGGEEEREGATAKGVERVGAAATIGEKERGSARVGEERGSGSHPTNRDQWPKLALPSELPTPAEKNDKRSTVSLRNAS